ncbi:MAG: hypothetical protein HY961_08035 [Ignavibacteriae bacterium]|nr:hypothetical protein [Ignavibacteriota bacterium]
MNLYDLLHTHANEILNEAVEAIVRGRVKNYVVAGQEHTHARLKALLALTQRAVKEKNLLPMLAHAELIASQRHSAGFDLWEVQTAFNVLEEAIWKRIIKDLPPDQFAEALGLVSTVLGAGKDALARSYVSLASKTKSPSLNMQSLFAGTEN